MVRGWSLEYLGKNSSADGLGSLNEFAEGLKTSELALPAAPAGGTAAGRGGLSWPVAADLPFAGLEVRGAGGAGGGVEGPETASDVRHISPSILPYLNTRCLPETLN